MNLLGKSREQIERATKDLDRDRLLDVIYSLATLEPMFTLQEVAERRHVSIDTLSRKIKRGELRAHKVIGDCIRIPLSSLRDWDRNTALFFSENGRGKS